MNAIKLLNTVDLYLDNTRGARYQRIEYDNAVNNAIKNYTDGILGNEVDASSNFQSDQKVSDELYTLIKSATIVPTADVILYPADYRFLTSIFVTIDGTVYYARPTTLNKLGPLLEDSFRAPSNTKPYYLQQLTGFKIYHGSGSVTSSTLNYVKVPASYSCGKDSQLINAAGTLTNTLTYYATEPSVYATVSYSIGDSITGTGAALTSGQVILSTNVVACDLPEKTHDEIAKRAASLLSGATADYQKSAFSEKEAKNS